MSYFQTKLFELIKAGGTLIENADHIAARKAVCESCPNYKIVKPVPGVSAMGCALCTCPFETKGHLLNYFSPSKGKIVKTECPKGLWEEIDSKFKK